jgi:AraC-like DNA-binding protein
LKRNCRFYASAAAAEAAGYRPCLRCRPELAPGYAAVDANRRLAQSAAGMIEDGRLADANLESLAGALSVTDRHLRRVFQQEFGVSPVKYAQTQRLLLAKRLLTEGAAPGSIAVLTRTLEPYAGTIARVFAEHSLPVAGQSKLLTDCSPVRFLLSAAAILPEFKFADVLCVIKNSYFRPQALGEFTSHTVAIAEMLVREGNVLRGRQMYAEAAQRLARRAEQKDHEEDEGEDALSAVRLGPLKATGQELEQALALLETLFDVVQAAGNDLATLGRRLQLMESILVPRGQAPALPPAPKRLAEELASLAALDHAMAQLRREAGGT